MVQGIKKFTSNNNKNKQNSAKFEKARLKSKQAKKGAPRALPKHNSLFREEAVLDRRLSKAIDVANEQKVSFCSHM